MIEFIFWIVGVCGAVTCKADATATPPTIIACMPEGLKDAKLQQINLTDKEGKIILKVIPELCPSA